MGQMPKARKLPPNYQVVFDVVNALDKGEHAAAGDIYATARQLRAGIGYSTVYRALDRLRDLGLVHEVRVPGSSSALYEAARGMHAHFRCQSCGRIGDIDYTLPPSEIAGVAESNRIAIGEVVVTFNGVCAGCREPGAAVQV